MIIKGKPLTEKSKILKETGKKIKSFGYNIFYLYYGLNPDYINALLIPELNMAVINKTKLDKNLSINNNTKIFDLNETINSKQISNYSKRIDDLKLNYNKFINKAVNNLSKAKSLHDELEEIYIKAMNFKEVDRKINKLKNNIF